MTAPKEERVAHVAEIIRDFWPHRMSQQAAEAIDNYYTDQFGSTIHGEKRIAYADGREPKHRKEDA